MLGIQLLSITFILIMLYAIRIHYKKNELAKAEAILWSVALLLLAILVTVPKTADMLRDLFSVTRLTDVIVIFALMGTFILLINNRIEISKLRSKLERLVRDRAIEQR
jgi:hypothetical protein